jgi:hypothetical protein
MPVREGTLRHHGPSWCRRSLHLFELILVGIFWDSKNVIVIFPHRWLPSCSTHNTKPKASSLLGTGDKSHGTQAACSLFLLGINSTCLCCCPMPSFEGFACWQYAASSDRDICANSCRRRSHVTCISGVRLPL